MEMPREIQEAIDIVISDVTILINMPLDSLIKKEELGKELNFGPIAYIFKNIADICRKIAKNDLNKLPKSKLDDMHNVLSGILGLYGGIKKFTSTQNNAPTVRANLIQNVHDQYNTLIDIFSRINFLLDDSHNELFELQKKINNASQLELESISIKSKKADEILSALRAASSEGGVTKESFNFFQQANIHERYAIAWLVTTVIATLITLLAITALIHKWEIPHDAISLKVILTADLVKEISIRIVIVSFGLYSISWTSGNYKAHRHNEVVNRHRATAIATFKTFVEGTSSPQIKEAILLQASQAAFSFQTSGYSDQAAEPTPQNTIIEVLRTIGSNKQN